MKWGIFKDWKHPWVARVSFKRESTKEMIRAQQKGYKAFEEFKHLDKKMPSLQEEFSKFIERVRSDNE